MFHVRYKHKNKRRCLPCLPCLPSCLPLKHNGKHPQTLLHKTLAPHVYHVYHFSRARIRENFSHHYIFNYSQVKKHGQKKPRVREYKLMVNMVNIYPETLCSKAFQCLPFFFNGKQKRPMVNIDNFSRFKSLYFKKKKCLPLQTAAQGAA